MTEIVEPGDTVMIVQPVGWGHELWTILVNVGLGVAVSFPGGNVFVGGRVDVGVIGTGDDGKEFMGDWVDSGRNSTNEIDNTPMVRPTESRATTNALPRLRKPCIISFPCFSC